MAKGSTHGSNETRRQRDTKEHESRQIVERAID